MCVCVLMGLAIHGFGKRRKEEEEKTTSDGRVVADDDDAMAVCRSWVGPLQLAVVLFG